MGVGQSPEEEGKQGVLGVEPTSSRRRLTGKDTYVERILGSARWRVVGKDPVFFE